MNVVIIKYNAGNVASVQFALERLGVSAIASNDAGRIMAADKVIFPGVGEASSAMKSLQSTGLDKVIRELKQPTLGICLGMQLMCARSEEGNTQGLGLFDVNVRRIARRGEEGELKLPHVGWNNLSGSRGRLYEGVASDEFMYYVHGYCADICADTTSVTDYIRPFSASIECHNFYGVQFHPEKSGNAGEKILDNFLKL